MGKNFSSFSEILGGRAEAGFKSFRALADSIAPNQGQAPFQESEATRVEPQAVTPPEVYESVVSNLIDKLAEAEESATAINESVNLEESEPKIDGKNLEEALSNLIKRIDGLSPSTTAAPEPKPEPIRETRKEEPGKAYKVYRDKDEAFECNLAVEGTSLADSKVRLVLESDAWNFVFYGKVYGDGRCVVPIKKGIPLVEGATGKIKLEVIAEDQLFVGWEDNFKIAASKKVKVDLKEHKSVSVSFNKPQNEKG